MQDAAQAAHASRDAAASLDRRAFLRAAGASVAVTALAGPAVALPAIAGASEAAARPEALLTPSVRRISASRRRAEAFRYRVECAQIALRRSSTAAVQESNGDEQDVAGFAGNYSKGLPHDDLGNVDPAAYAAVLRAAGTGRPEDFEAIPLAGERKLVSPQAGLAFELEGADPQALRMRAAPSFSSAEAAAEMVELYWMALLRDLPFEEYESNALVRRAVDDLTRLSDFRGPKTDGRVTPATLFRGSTAGDLTGPYLAQFLLREIPYGSLTIAQRQLSGLPDVDYMTSYDDWLAVQNGALPPDGALDPTPRHLRSLRDLARYVHVDALFEAYLNACLILLALDAPIDPGLPPASSRTQYGFAEYGGPHVLTLVTEVATRALRTVWWQKWMVHRRLRPEEYGGRVHNHLTGRASHLLHADILDSEAIAAVHEVYGTYLLPLAYPEGCPGHPSYGSGHATVAGACVTVLKAFFDESFVLPDPVVPTPDGLALVPWNGPPLTVGHELDKVASNIASARNGAGLHWRTDFTESLRLGEAVALAVLEEQKLGHNQAFSYTLTRLDGTTITI